MSEIEAQKEQLVRCIRMLEHQGIMDFNGHASARIAEDRMLINIGNCQRSRLTSEDICTIDFDGTLIEGNGNPPLEFHLHAGIYKTRADVDAIIHCHPNWSTILTTAGAEYLPVYAQGTLVYPLPVLDSPNSINNPEMAKKLTDKMGNRPAALMKAHGAVTTGKSIVDAFVLLNYLEDNAQRQYMAAQIGTPYSFTEEEIALCQEKLWSDALFKRTWDHFGAKLDASA
jgi:ribulose-5-phosphate 4-epimerase/fuculose-1-phosphate aldolase